MPRRTTVRSKGPKAIKSQAVLVVSLTRDDEVQLEQMGSGDAREFVDAVCDLIKEQIKHDPRFDTSQL